MWLAGGLAAAAVFFTGKKAKAAGGSGMAGVTEAPADGPKAEPIYVGKPGDPEVEEYLREMNSYFASRGIDMNLVTAEELTRMRKAPGKPYAIPPRAYWPRMARTLKFLFIPLRTRMGIPLQIANGYRPPAYNKAVTMMPDGTWTKGSRHQWFDGLDIQIPLSQSTHQRRKQLALEAALLYLQEGDRLGVGFGAYNPAPPSAPGNVHLDASSKKRTWKHADYWVDMARSVS